MSKKLEMLTPEEQKTFTRTVELLGGSENKIGDMVSFSNSVQTAALEGEQMGLIDVRTVALALIGLTSKIIADGKISKEEVLEYLDLVLPHHMAAEAAHRKTLS